MSRVLVIGCGGVAGVAIQKCCQVSEVFTELCIASRTKEKCDALAQKLAGKTQTVITTAQVDADDVDQVIALIREYRPELVMNIALPYQDLTIMDACLACGVNYMDTANYEPEDTEDPAWRAIYEKRCKEAGFSAYFDYSWQWAYKKKFEEAGLTALLGSGFDPGVTQAYCAYEDGYETAILAEFEKNPQADMIIFNIEVEESRRTYHITERKRVHWYNCGRYGAVSFAVRRDSLLASRSTFSLLFGGGAKYSNGEDSLFLTEFIQKGYKVYTAPVTIGREEAGDSTWFHGYNEKFFHDRGVLYHYLYGRLAGPLALRFLYAHKGTLCSEVTIKQAKHWMRDGIREAGKRGLA